MAGKVYVAKDSFTCLVAGEQLACVKGVTRVREGHPLISAQPDHFELVNDHVHYEWETAAKETATTPQRGAKLR